MSDPYLMNQDWTNHPIFQSDPMSRREAMQWLINNSKDGTVLSTIRSMADAWKWPKTRAERFILLLIEGGLLVRECDLPETESGTRFGTESGTKKNRLFICNSMKIFNEITKAETESGTRFGTESGTRNLPPQPEKPKQEDREYHDRREINMVIETYNEVAKKRGLPIAKTLTDQRRKKIVRVLKIHKIEGWLEAMEKLSTSKFCCGGGPDGWKADFDFLLQEKSFTKLIEGSYNRDKPTRNQTDSLFAGI